MLLLKFTICFSCCSLGCPLDMCTLRAKIMIASNFSWENGWERVKSGLLSNIPSSQTFPVTTKIHADIWASRSIFCVKRNGLNIKVEENYLKSCFTRIAPTTTSSISSVSTAARRRKTPVEDVARRKGQKKRNNTLLDLNPGWEKVKEHPSCVGPGQEKRKPLKCLFVLLCPVQQSINGL